MTAARYAYDTETHVTIAAVWCPGCGVPYGLAVSFRKQRQEDHKSWRCPNGCSLSFPVGSSDSEKRAEKAEAELEAARSLARREAQRRERAEQEARISEYQRRAAKGQLTKAKKRIAAGVCPCCNRTFQNLANHMAGQHPDYAETDHS